MAILNPRSDEPRALPEVLTPSDIDTASHNSTPPMSPRSPRAVFIFLGILRILPAWGILVFMVISGWVSRIVPDEATSTQSESHTDIQTPPAATPTIRRSIWDPDSGLSEKVRKACEVARADGYRYIWVDSSCIDKTSSSELSEAINSMYNWYRDAHVCYTFLADVPSDEDVRAKGSMFRRSRWFKRCWTLQELIAPIVVVFLSQTWEDIGTKDVLADIIYEITSIDRGILTHERALSDESVADRMRWAANREATRVEDEAYSLLGIFGITMPTLYGEGQHAFRRLQEEILRRIPDQSLFAWGDSCMPFTRSDYTKFYPCFTDPGSETLFAPSPRSFKLSRDSESDRSQTIQATGNSIKSLELPVQEYIHTPYGIRTQLRLFPGGKALNAELEIQPNDQESNTSTGTWYLALLGFQKAGNLNRLLSRPCYLRNHSPGVEFLFVPNMIKATTVTAPASPISPPILTISLDDLMKHRNQLQTKTVYLPYPQPSNTARRLQEFHKTLNLTLPERVLAALRRRGYLIQGPTEDNRNSFSFSLVHAPFIIHIHYRHITYHHGYHGSQFVMIQARVWLTTSDQEALRTDAATILCSPPYTSVTWADTKPWGMTLPTQVLHLVAETGETMILQLGLHLMARSRYNVHVDVDVLPTSTTRPGNVGALRTDLRSQSRDLYAPHETFKPILTGSVRRALEMKRYSPRLVLDPRLGGFRTHSLTLSHNTDSFAIVVKFFCTLLNTSRGQSLLVVARITLESLIPNDEAVQDGPHVAVWRDCSSWRDSWTKTLENKNVVLTTPTGQLLTLHLGFDLAWQSEYHLRVNIESEPGHSTQTSQYPRKPKRLYPAWAATRANPTLTLAHRSVDLTLPGHVRHALHDQGYQVRFEKLDTGRGGESSDPVRHLLTFSHITAGITIVIEYSHCLQVVMDSRKPKADRDLRDPDINYPFLLAEPHPGSGLSAPEVRWTRCQQELIFQASARALPLRGDTGSLAAVQDDVATATVDWNTKYKYDHRDEKIDGWRQHLPNKDITLTPPTGNELVLRLGFYYVWNGEYCLMVQINPRKPLSRTPSRDEGPLMPDYELDEAGMEYTRRSLVGRTEAEWSEEAHDEPLPTDPGTAVVSSESSPACGEDGDSDGGGSGGGNGRGSDDEEPAPSGASEA